MPGIEIPEHERYREAIDAVRKRVPVPRVVWDRMESEERERAFTVAQVARTRVLQQVLDAVKSAVEKGTTLEDFRGEVADKLISQWGGEIPGRIETIFRTNVLGSYTEGRHAINSAPAVKEARPYWRYEDTQNDRECEVCNDCHGTVLPADDPWWDTHHPLLHHQCECTVTALTPEEAEDEGVSERGPDVDVDEDFGHQPSAVAKDWAPDLENITPELRGALKERLARFEDQAHVRPAPEVEPEPEPEPVIEPPPAVKLEQHRDDFSGKYVDRKSEVASILDNSGNPVFFKKGGRASVRFTQPELTSMRDGHLVHNHPSGSSLSAADLSLTVYANSASITAVGRDRVSGKIKAYSFNRPAKGWPPEVEIRAAWARSHTEAVVDLARRVRAGELTPLQARLSIGHEAWSRVQQRLDLGYKVEEIEGKKRR